MIDLILGRLRLAILLAVGLLMGVTLALTAAAGMYAQDVEPSATTAATVSEHLQRQLDAAAGPVSFLVIMQEQVNGVALVQAQGAQAAARADRARILYTELTAVARRTQAPVRNWLDANQVPYRAFYLVNMVEVWGDAAAVEVLRRLPGVDRLVANPTVGEALTVETAAATWLKPWLADSAAQSQARPYGIDFTQAPAVWALGYRGEAIVIGSQDTGVEWDHPALRANYRGVISDTVDHAYNWFDAFPQAGRPLRCANEPQTPCDDHGHGTHTVGTMLGNVGEGAGEEVGMAPAAQWIGCRNMDHGVGTPASYTACFEFFLAPYPQAGDPMTDGRPELGAHIVNNSWGCPPAEGCDADSLRQVVETARAAGQMVVASAGNSGSSCSTVKDPIAIYDAVFSVGAHGSAGGIAVFSSRGPVTVDGSSRRKPDLAAPGLGVRSATVNGGYSFLSGTSMASPHVAGAVALLWSAVPTLTSQIDLTEQVLIKSATPMPASQCEGGDGTPVTPNNTYGFGILDVLAAVEMAQQPGALTVVITATGGGELVHVRDLLTDYTYALPTNGDGEALFAPLYAGDYAVMVGDPGLPEEQISLATGEAKTLTFGGSPPVWQLFFPLFLGQGNLDE